MKINWLPAIVFGTIMLGACSTHSKPLIAPNTILEDDLSIADTKEIKTAAKDTKQTSLANTSSDKKQPAQNQRDQTSAESAQIPVSKRAKTNLASRKNVKPFIDQMVNKHQMDRQWLTDVFNKTSLKKSIVEAMNRPAEKKTWGEYRPIFITEKRITEGVNFYKQYRTHLERAEKKYGVPAEIITAIIGVETSYGANKGNWAVIDALSTLAFDYPRRADYFAGELEKFLLIVQETKQDPFSFQGSYAGAMGYPQFMPSSYRAYAVDFDGDGVRDLWNNPVDAIGSVANYLAKNNWVRDGSIALKTEVRKDTTEYLKYMQTGKLAPPKYTIATLKKAGVMTNVSEDGKALLLKFELSKNPDVNEWWLGYYNFYAITRYNNSTAYALAVTQLAYAIRSKH